MLSVGCFFVKYFCQKIGCGSMEKAKNFVFGINPVLEKLKASPDEVLEILFAEGPERQSLRSISVAASQHGVRVTYVHPSRLDRLADGQRHQGVLANVQPYGHLEMNDLLQRISTSSGAARVLVLDGLTDPRNFGALLRTAEATGVQHVLIPKDRSVDVTPVVVKASAGAAHHLNVYKATNLRRAIVALKECGFWIVGLDAQSPESIYARTYPARLAIVLGSEGKGVRPINLRECDFLVSIPMLGKVASLNVAVAGAVFLYETLRQNHSIDKVGGKRY
jgi:23S rRNA (guanosine2251-2'-O)-methyltransferase